MPKLILSQDNELMNKIKSLKSKLEIKNDFSVSRKVDLSYKLPISEIKRIKGILKDTPRNELEDLSDEYVDELIDLAEILALKIKQCN